VGTIFARHQAAARNVGLNPASRPAVCKDF